MLSFVHEYLVHVKRIVLLPHISIHCCIYNLFETLEQAKHALTLGHGVRRPAGVAKLSFHSYVLLASSHHTTLRFHLFKFYHILEKNQRDNGNSGIKSLIKCVPLT